jgi:hypothetical protein
MAFVLPVREQLGFAGGIAPEKPTIFESCFVLVEQSFH